MNERKIFASYRAGPMGAPHPSAAPSGPLPFGPVFVNCEGVEVTQVVQDMAHSVPLVADKTTVVRVYLGTASPAPVAVRGALRMKSSAPGSAWIQVISINSVTVDPAENGQLRLKRERLEKALNFRLPPETTTVGDWSIELSQVELLSAPGGILATPLGAGRSVTFQVAPALRVRIVGVRYSDPTRAPLLSHEPAAKDFALIRSWLRRAYPVPQVVWSQVTLDGPHAWPFGADDNNAFIRALRAQDMAQGGDVRTHYFGLVDDGGGSCFMRGLASGVPSAPDPSTVASGPSGSSFFPWDTDGSYGDWYTGHELGHTLGRAHAMFCGAGGGAPYPYPAGQISPDDGSFVGLDVGDADQALPMRALPGAVWHDVMTSCTDQWVSDFTYAAIRDRLVAEAVAPAGAPVNIAGTTPAGGIDMAADDYIHVVATVDLTQNVGRFRFVNPLPVATPGATPGATAKDYLLRLKGPDGAVLVEYPAPFYADACVDADGDERGIVDVSVPSHPSLASLELVRAGQVLDNYTAGLGPTPLHSIQTMPVAVAMSPGGSSADPVITWSHAPSVALHSVAPGSGITYTVQLSIDEGRTWSTVGLGLRQPQTRIDRTLLEGASTVQIRVVATNGFRSESTTRTLSVDDL